MVLLVLVSIMDAGCVNVSVFLLAEGVAEEEKKRGRKFPMARGSPTVYLGFT
jgi:hypothetical protein